MRSTTPVVGHLHGVRRLMSSPGSASLPDPIRFNHAAALPRAPRRTPLPRVRMALGSIAIVAGLVHLARDPGQAIVEAGAPAPVATVAAVPSIRPPDPPRPVSRLDAPELAGLAQQAETRVTETGGRVETLLVGAFEGSGPHLNLSIEVSPDAAPSAPSFFVQTVRRAAEAGLGVVRSAQPSGVATRFGPAEVANVVLAGAMERSCAGIRLSRPDIALAGWFCGASDEPAEPARIACLIDQLAVDSRADPLLKAAFAQAQREGATACGPRATPAPGPLAAPFTAARSGDGARRRRDKPPVMRSASREHRS